MTRKEQGIHDKGIADRIQQIWYEDGYHLLAVIPNVYYKDKSYAPLIEGEIDILKLYNTGGVGFEEVKSTINNKNVKKAQEQLTRAKNVFKYYKPEIASYFINCKTIIKY